ncbi:PEPM-like protein [Mya arenaria]|uniref:PEPM-like protein n=1 Tax=Mya arenaria TaxID=6604 RepID=A0ABY7DYJ3_MYAAR|nr:PEPM-like protein [Mya arenaria]
MNFIITKLGIWGSGLSLSAQWCVRDSNEASWTQVVDMLEFMSDATSIPILLDADTGYGNFNNARRLVRKLEDRGIAGACMEDKLFPKTNSLHEGRAQPLADMEEFALKIKACKDAQRDPDFCIVARVEAFIAGWGLDEALKRATAYREAGPSDNRAHQVLHDTYSAFPGHGRFHGDMGEPQHAGVDQGHAGNIASVKEVFRLQDEPELVSAEDKYLPTKPQEN